MDIKVGDIVEYCGRKYRVLHCLNEGGRRFHLFSYSGNIWVYESDVKLVESIEVPTLKIGDTVLVNDVRACEKTPSNGVWVHRMGNRIGKTFEVDKCMDHKEYGPLVSLNGLWFRTYHLEKVKDYDMI